MIGLILGGLALAYCLLDDEDGDQKEGGGKNEGHHEKGGNRSGGNHRGQQHQGNTERDRSRSIKNDRSVNVKSKDVVKGSILHGKKKGQCGIKDQNGGLKNGSKVVKRSKSKGGNDGQKKEGKSKKTTKRGWDIQEKKTEKK